MFLNPQHLHFSAGGFVVLVCVIVCGLTKLFGGSATRRCGLGYNLMAVGTAFCMTLLEAWVVVGIVNHIRGYHPHDQRFFWFCLVALLFLPNAYFCDYAGKAGERAKRTPDPKNE